MVLNESIKYEAGELYCDHIAVQDIVEVCDTPLYIYSLPRVLANYRQIKAAFSGINAHIHYSAKANANLSILRTLIEAGAGIDAVSGGEIYKALKAGAKPENIVFAGVGKSPSEIRYAVGQDVGWFNVENVDECRIINEAAVEANTSVNVALRLNPEVTANTHPYIATGHGGAKFGLTAETIRNLLVRRSEYPNINFSGIHIHIGSQLHDIEATQKAIELALELITPYPNIQTVNIGGGFPVAYRSDAALPSVEMFAQAITPLLKGYTVLLEPGRSIVADAGMLVTQVLYVKKQAGQTFLIVDGSMTELIRPALYEAHHEIIPVIENKNVSEESVSIVGPVCETADILAKDRQLPEMQPGDLLAVMTAGAYGMVMASNYNARSHPAEVIICEDGHSWKVARRRQTWEDLVALEGEE